MMRVVLYSVETWESPRPSSGVNGTYEGFLEESIPTIRPNDQKLGRGKLPGEGSLADRRNRTCKDTEGRENLVPPQWLGQKVQYSGEGRDWAPVNHTGGL